MAVRRQRSGAATAALLFFCVVAAGAGCADRRSASPSAEAKRQGEGGLRASAVRSGAPPVAEKAAEVSAADVFIVPSAPSRISPPSVSVRPRPGQAAPEVAGVTWIVDGQEKADGPSLAPSLFARGDEIQAKVALRTGTGEMVRRTEPVVAGNALPAVTAVAIEPRAPKTKSSVHAVVEAGDPDGDPLSFRYRWFVDGRAVPGNEGDTLTLDGVKKGSWIRVEATPNDGAADGAWKSSDRYLVVNAPPVVRSGAPTTIPPSHVLTHTIVAEDPDGDPLTYVLEKGPKGMTLAGATLLWPVTRQDLGKTAEVVVRISDDDGASTILTMGLTPRAPAGGAGPHGKERP